MIKRRSQPRHDMYCPYIDRTISITTSEVFLPGFEPTTKVHFTPAIDHYANGGIIIYFGDNAKKITSYNSTFHYNYTHFQ